MALIIAAILVFYLANQVFSHLLIFFPIFLINLVPNVGQIFVIILLFVTLSWFFGE